MKKFIKNINKNREGFSIIEFVIVVFILSILSLMALAAISSRTLTEKLEINTGQLAQNILLIQNYAMVGYKDSAGEVADNYCIYFEVPDKYIIFRDEDGNNLFNLVNDIVMEEVKLYPNIGITGTDAVLCSTVPKGLFCYDDDNANGGTVCDSTTTFTVEVSGTNVTKSVEVNHLTGKVGVKE